MPEKNHLKNIHRYLTGESTPEEKIWIEKWIEEKPENRRKFESIKKIWEVEPEKELKTDLKKAWLLLEEQMDKAGSIKSNQKKNGLKYGYGRVRVTGLKPQRIWLRVAAILVTGFLLSLYFLSYLGEEPAYMDGTGQDKIVMQEVKTDRAHQSKMTFSDGSVVRLNSASYIRFPKKFDSDVREVYLEGEAWFDVRHNPDVEFIVNTRDARVRVLGTEFNVKSHPDEEQMEVVVADGKVSVRALVESAPSEDSLSEVVLTNGEMSRVIAGQQPSQPEQVNVSVYLSWLKGIFVYEGVPFGRVLDEWKRQFDVDFKVESEDLLTTPFTGEFRHESFDEMLRLTSITLEFNYERENKIITIIK